MSTVSQSHQDLMQHLRDSIGFLKASASAFDGGFRGEAKRLATTIRVLLHDTSNSKSLLGLLGLKDKLRYVSTTTRYDPNLSAYQGLVGHSFGPNGASYWAPLGDGPPTRYLKPPMSFEDWWNEPVIVDTSKMEFTRRDLVLSLANKDGGAHVDSHLDGKYAGLTRGNSLGSRVSEAGVDRPLSDIELHSVRQVAYELMQSLEGQTENGA